MLFAGTIGDNIAYGKHGKASAEEVRKGVQGLAGAELPSDAPWSWQGSPCAQAPQQSPCTCVCQCTSTGQQ